MDHQWYDLGYAVWDSLRIIHKSSCIDHPLGLPDLKRPGVIAKVHVGNILMRLTAKAISLCMHHQFACSLENLHTSRLWICPPIQVLIRSIYTQLCITVSEAALTLYCFNSTPPGYIKKHPVVAGPEDPVGWYSRIYSCCAKYAAGRL